MAQNNFLPLYQKIANEFLNKIFNNELKPGDKIPTEFELMDIYKVSRITVVRALKELSNQGYITRTRKSGSMISKNMLDVLGDPPKFYKVLPLVMPISPISEFALFSSIEKAAQENGYLVSLYNTERDLNKERDVLNHLAATNIDGLICFPIESYSNLAVFARLINKKTPMVFIDHPLNGVDIPYVASDNRRGMHKMTKYLINKGHKNIAFLSYSLASTNEKLRFDGYIKALIESQISPNNDYFFEINHFCENGIMLSENNEKVSKIVGEMLVEMRSLPIPPTALICCYDLLAYYVEQQATLLKIKIPDDLTIVGFDNTSWSALLEIPLTSVAQDYETMAKVAVDTLISIQKHQPVSPSYIFDVKLIERNSVKEIKDNI